MRGLQEDEKEIMYLFYIVEIDNKNRNDRNAKKRKVKRRRKQKLRIHKTLIHLLF